MRVIIGAKRKTQPSDSMFDGTYSLLSRSLSRADTFLYTLLLSIISGNGNRSIEFFGYGHFMPIRRLKPCAELLLILAVKFKYFIKLDWLWGSH
ncbi:hypothetical protein AYI70_g11650 [Smittium culicis]|uniref:Uncharacterized protein n=1 Tax=Smittium culicis TaxID=133412 RepID=A0A1R1X0X9_9FUNG|nr:hypothetical protein AYI70_g11650 [Smittium culicis]